MIKKQFAGSRIIKTAISIFITALICELLHWPPVFAVITAIVTIEPTVSDSIRKGIIRFPASAIGSAYAVIFIAIFGNSPITYTLAGTLTIATCFKLRLHAGLVVATITSVAMVEVIHDSYFLAFLTRLGTTTVGLVVSTIVNMCLLPPDYKNNIEIGMKRLQIKVGEAIELVFKDILINEQSDSIKRLQDIENSFQKMERFIRFQKDESKYHPLLRHQNQFSVIQRKVQILQMIHYHLEKLKYTPLEIIPWSMEEKEHVLFVTQEFKESLKQGSFDIKKHEDQFKKIAEKFWEDNEEITKNSDQYPTSFPPELIILYELLSIGNLVKKYFSDESIKKVAG